ERWRCRPVDSVHNRGRLKIGEITGVLGWPGHRASQEQTRASEDHLLWPPDVRVSTGQTRTPDFEDRCLSAAGKGCVIGLSVKARSSVPVSGWTKGIPLLSRETCSRAWTISACSQRREHSSDTRNPCRKASMPEGPAGSWSHRRKPRGLRMISGPDSSGLELWSVLCRCIGVGLVTHGG